MKRAIQLYDKLDACLWQKPSVYSVYGKTREDITTSARSVNLTNGSIDSNNKANTYFTWPGHSVQ